MPIHVHLFLGYLQEREISFHLNQSQHWKENKAVHSLALKETSWENQTYVGLFIPPLLTCSEIIKKQKEIKDQMKVYCPKLNLDNFPIYIFSQIFFF